jgi:hypothetical protein
LGPGQERAAPDGGSSRILAEAPRYANGLGFSVDPNSGAVIYSALERIDSYIERLHLARQ